MAEEAVMLVNHHHQILNRILQSGDEAEVLVVEVEVEVILKWIFGIDTLTFGLELLRTSVVVVVVEVLKDYDRMPL